MAKAKNPPDPVPYEQLPTNPPAGLFVDPSILEATPENPAKVKGDLEVADSRLGRIPQFDQRSRSFPMRAAIDATGKRYRKRSYTWSVGQHLDQGAHPACVGYAWTHELIARPAVVNQGADFAYWVYRVAQKYDAWAGERYEGTSVLAGAKVIQQKPPAMPEGRDLIGEYRWVFGDLDDLVKTLGYFGPCIFGTNWTANMMEPDADGFIHATGEVYGGHAYLVKGVDVAGRRFLVHNSWGTGWGMGGDAWLAWDDALALLHDDGECCVPMRRHSLEGD